VRNYRGADGRAPVTGTEWEYEEARAHAEETGAPALLVFRNQDEVPISVTDLMLQAGQLAQLKALSEFWQRHFEDRGKFLTAHTSYRRLADFEAKLGTQLRGILDELARKEAAALTSWFECPFRGLEAYDFEHSPIFFGRDAAVQQARKAYRERDRWHCLPARSRGKRLRQVIVGVRGAGAGAVCASRGPRSRRVAARPVPP
jgi:hypothetical protein